MQTEKCAKKQTQRKKRETEKESENEKASYLHVCTHTLNHTHAHTVTHTHRRERILSSPSCGVLCTCRHVVVVLFSQYYVTFAELKEMWKKKKVWTLFT